MRNRLICFSLLLLAIALMIAVWEYGKVQEHKIINAIAEARCGRSAIELRTIFGEPLYVFDEFPAELGMALIPDKLGDKEIELQCYVVRSMPPIFLVVKVDRNTGLIIAATIETS